MSGEAAVFIAPVQRGWGTASDRDPPSDQPSERRCGESECDRAVSIWVVEESAVAILSRNPVNGFLSHFGDPTLLTILQARVCVP